MPGDWDPILISPALPRFLISLAECLSWSWGRFLRSCLSRGSLLPMTLKDGGKRGKKLPAAFQDGEGLREKLSNR